MSRHLSAEKVSQLPQLPPAKIQETRPEVDKAPSIPTPKLATPQTTQKNGLEVHLPDSPPIAIPISTQAKSMIIKGNQKQAVDQLTIDSSIAQTQDSADKKNSKDKNLETN